MTQRLMEKYKDSLREMMMIHEETLSKTVSMYQTQLETLINRHQDTLAKIIETNQEQIDKMKIGSSPTEEQLKNT